VTLSLTDDVGFGLRGMPAGALRFTLAQLSPGQNGSASEWQSYITRSSGGIPDAQANAEGATSGTYADNGDGTYTYTFSQALTAYPAGPAFDAAKTHRLGLEIRGGAPANNAPYDFVPAGGSPTFTRLIVNNATCNACHDNLGFHGEARFDIEYCVTCHNPYSIDGDTAAEPWGGTVDMKQMIHKIHYGAELTNGYFIVGYGDNPYDYSGIEFPQDVRNCTTCHAESDTTIPQASNWRTVPNRDACGSCHDDIDWEAGDHIGGIGTDSDESCVTCHGENSQIANGALRVDVVHTIPEAVASQAFEYDVVSAVNTAPGESPTVQIRVLDPTNPNYAAGVNVSWNTDNLGNVDPNDDLARPSDSGAPFQPIRIDFKSGATNVGGNVFEKAAAANEVIPTGATGSGVAYLEGHPQVDLGSGPVSIGVKGSGITFAIDDPAPVNRRQVVDIAKCNDCHNTLALHGDNRVGNPELCANCHNPNATDIQRRVPASACDTELGLDDVSIDLKRMVHRIHAGNVGVCGFRNSAHDYTDVVYPGKLNNCEGCHLAGTYYPVDPTEVMATTIDAAPGTNGLDGDRSSLLDDVAISPNSAVCSSCHTSDLARNHMIQNGGDFAAGKDETGAMISSGTETCQLCHGPGASFDVGVMHGVGLFQFN
jgi:OmcA/MtrC family decaheme c-type cytochrome